MKISKAHWPKYLFFTVLSIITASGNMGVVYTINHIINDYFTNTPVLANEYLIYFLASLILFITCRWIVSKGIIGFTQNMLKVTRLEILEMVLKSPFTSLVNSRPRIYGALTRDADNIVNASINMVDIFTNIIVITICFVYMGLLSWKLLLCMLLLVMFTLAVYALSVRKTEKLMKLSMSNNDVFVKYLNEILTGFKEITMDRRKGFDIKDKHIQNSINASALLNQKSLTHFLNNRIIGQIAFYLFIAIMLLYLGEAFDVKKAVVVNFIFLVLYIWSPIETVVLFIPSLSTAKVSATRIEELEKEMYAIIPDDTEVVPASTFATLSMQNMSYSYLPAINADESEQKFCIGPIDFELNKGDVVFISGGNGSGKTTFLNILAGIFTSDEGTVKVNDSPIQIEQRASYRMLFAPVFSDFHLFDEIYGISNIAAEKANMYLKIFEIEDKIYFDSYKFSNIKLSTGQRKRLALISAMLEKKPVLILDEFAADQDPYFKKKFYTEIIPFIRSEGFTIVAITHDDNYYQYCTKRYKMDGGKMMFVSPDIEMINTFA